jgi:hypothetical protein
MFMHRSFRPFVLFLLGAALLAPLPGCDRHDEAPPPIVVVTPQPVRGVIAQTAFDRFVSGAWVGIEVLVSNRGVLDITVDWTSDETWMYVYFGDTPCDAAALTGETCPFLIRSETKDPRPRILYTDLLEPATYILYLYNVPRVPFTEVGSDVTEAVSIQLGLTVGYDPLAAGSEGDPVQLGRPLVLSPPRL